MCNITATGWVEWSVKYYSTLQPSTNESENLEFKRAKKVWNRYKVAFFQGELEYRDQVWVHFESERPDSLHVCGRWLCSCDPILYFVFNFVQLDLYRFQFNSVNEIKFLNRIKHNLFMSVSLTENGRTRYYLEMQLWIMFFETMSIWKKNGLTKRILFILTRSPDRNSISGLVIRILLVYRTGSHLCFSINLLLLETAR